MGNLPSSAGPVTGIIAALSREAAPLLETLEREAAGGPAREMAAGDETATGRNVGWNPYLGILSGARICVGFSGCGKVRAAALTQLMIDRHRPGCIIHYGTAGAIAPDVRPGDVILGEKSVEADYCERMCPGEPKPESLPDPGLSERLAARFKECGLAVRRGIIVCQDGDVIDPETKNRLWEEYRGLCTCWEGVAVGRVCNINNVPYVQLRGITDLADSREDAAADFETRVTEVSRMLLRYVRCGIEAIASGGGC